MPASSSADAASSNSFGGPNGGGSLNPLEVVVIAIVGILFALIIASAFKKS